MLNFIYSGIHSVANICHHFSVCLTLLDCVQREDRCTWIFNVYNLPRGYISSLYIFANYQRSQGKQNKTKCEVSWIYMGVLTKSRITPFPEGLTSVPFNKQGVSGVRTPGDWNPVWVLVPLSFTQDSATEHSLNSRTCFSCWEEQFFCNLDSPFYLNLRFFFVLNS